MSQVFVTPMPLLRLMDAVGMPQLAALRGSMGVIKETMLRIVAERRAALERGGGGKDDLLGDLLTAEDPEGHRATDEELWHDIHDIMGAGHETTATTAAATIYCVSAHPDVQAKVDEELAALHGRVPKYADLDKLPYLTQVAPSPIDGLPSPTPNGSTPPSVVCLCNASALTLPSRLLLPSLFTL